METGRRRRIFALRRLCILCALLRASRAFQEAQAATLPLCGEVLSDGRWVPIPPDTPKAFDLCMGPYDSKLSSHGLKGVPLHRPANWSLPYQPQLASACECDSTLKDRTPRRRPSECYAWQPSACHLPGWSAKEFCRHSLGRRRLLIVGDSTMMQFAWSLWSLVRGQCEDQIDYAGADTLLGGCMGNLGRGPELGQIFSEREKLGQRPDIVVLSAGAHIYKTKCGFGAFRGPDCVDAPMRCTHHDHVKYKTMHSQMTRNELPPASRERELNRMNTTEHVEAMRFVLRRTLEATTKLRDEARHASNGTWLPEFIWKSQSPGHLHCQSAHGPQQPFAGYPNYPSTEYMFNWPAFPHFDREARDTASRSDGSLHYMDASMLYQRPDGHGTDILDCLHYCTPGPLDEVARVLQHVLLTKLPSRATTTYYQQVD